MAAKLYLLELQIEADRHVAPVKAAHDRFVKELKPHYDKPYTFFISRGYVSLIASFEFFVQEIVTAIVKAHPKKVGHIDFKLAEILDSTTHDELVSRAIEESLNKIMYKKPLEYLREVADLLSIEQQPLAKHWPDFVEAKARRDLGMHNGWRCNATYLRKVGEVGIRSNFEVGETAFPVDDIYLTHVLNTLDNLADLMMDAVFEKHLGIVRHPSSSGDTK